MNRAKTTTIKRLFVLPGRLDRHWGGRAERFPDGSKKGLVGGGKDAKTTAGRLSAADDAQPQPRPQGQPGAQAGQNRPPAQAEQPAVAQPGTSQGGQAQQAVGAGQPAPAAAVGSNPRPTGTRGDASNPIELAANNPRPRLPAFEELTRRESLAQFPDFRPRQPQTAAPAADHAAMPTHTNTHPAFLTGHMEPPPQSYYQIPTHTMPPMQPQGNVMYAYPPQGFITAEQVVPYPTQQQFIQPVYPFHTTPMNVYPPPPQQQILTQPHSMYQQFSPPPVPSAPPQPAIVRNPPVPQPAPVQTYQAPAQASQVSRFSLQEYPPLGAPARPRPPTPHPDQSHVNRRSMPMEGVEITRPRAQGHPPQQSQHQARSQVRPSTSSASSSNINSNTHDAALQASQAWRISDDFWYQGKLFKLNPKNTKQTNPPSGASSQLPSTIPASSAPSQFPSTNPHVRSNTNRMQQYPQPMETQPPASHQPHTSSTKGKGKGASKRRAKDRDTPSPPTKKPRDGSAERPLELPSSDEDFQT